MVGIYSCESTNKPNSNPLNYNQEQPYFNIEPFIPYYKLDNRIDIGMIYNYNTNKDSNYIRATFYDNREFRNIGDLYLGKLQIYSMEAEELFDINQLIDGFIEFGTVYFKKDLVLDFNKDYLITSSNNFDFPTINKNISILDDRLSVINVLDLEQISKKRGFGVKTNLTNYPNTRIRIFNKEKNIYFSLVLWTLFL